MKNNYFKYWLLIIGIPLALFFVMATLATGDGGIVSGLLLSLTVSAPTAFILSMFHKWYREGRPKKSSGRRVFTDVGVRRIGIIREVLLWASIALALYLPVFGIFYAILGVLDSEALGWLLYGAVIYAFLGLAGYSIVLKVFSRIERYYGFEINSMGKFFKLRKYFGRLVMAIVILFVVFYSITTIMTLKDASNFELKTYPNGVL